MDTEKPMKFDGTVLKSLREKAGLTQMDVAFKAREKGIKKANPEMISRHENGEMEPRAGAVIFYANLFRVDYTYFFKEFTDGNSKTRTTDSTSSG